jgi:hypothetical protein
MKKLIVSAYNNFVRPRLPTTGDRKYVSGIELVSEKYRRHVFDEFIPIPTPYEQYLKERNIALIREEVNTADVGISIGGGYGVTAVALSEFVHELHIYEGSTDLINEIEKNLTANNTTANIHAKIVGEAIDIDGNVSTESISPRELPLADVVEMDCEGAEISILPEITNIPDQFVIETHPQNGAPTDEVIHMLNEIGHTVIKQVPDPVDGDVLVTKG